MTVQATSATEDQIVDEMLETTYRDLEQGAVDRAESTYRQLLEDSAHRADALNGLGLVAMLRGQMGNAIDLLRQVLDITLAHAAARLNLVKSLMIEGQRLTGQGSLENAAAMLGAARKEIDHEEARAISVTCRVPLGRMFSVLGVEYQRQRRDFSTAIEMLRMARSLVPEEADLRVGQAASVPIPTDGSLRRLSNFHHKDTRHEGVLESRRAFVSLW
jgi:tetratricopeptide (TPR) repeat protein